MESLSFSKSGMLLKGNRYPDVSVIGVVVVGTRSEHQVEQS